jgi:hypothetical protein
MTIYITINGCLLQVSGNYIPAERGDSETEPHPASLEIEHIEIAEGNLHDLIAGNNELLSEVLEKVAEAVG